MGDMQADILTDMQAGRKSSPRDTYGGQFKGQLRTLAR